MGGKGEGSGGKGGGNWEWGTPCPPPHLCTTLLVLAGEVIPTIIMDGTLYCCFLYRIAFVHY